MRSWINNKIGCLATLFIPLLLGACSAVGPVQQAEDPRLAQLSAGMDSCLASQSRTSEQLRAQARQLEQQALRLDQLSEAIQAAATGPGENQGFAPVSDEACAQLLEVPSKLMVGQMEQIWLQNIHLTLPARIDTGAETSSLDARNIELFERDGRRWVRFEILHPATGDALLLERKLTRTVMILQSNTVESERRPVIKLGVTIGHISQTAEFTLSNRSHLDYQVLIGRNILKDFMVVDVSKENIAPFVEPDTIDESSGIVP